MKKEAKNKRPVRDKKTAATLQAITDNFSVFTSEVIGFNNAQFHNEMDDIISKKLYKKICIALPRGHGKTSHLSIAYPLWEIAKDHNVRILLVSSTAEVARSFMTEIRSHIENNQRYQLWAKSLDPHGRGVTPKLRTGKKREEHWSGDSIIIGRDDLKLKDPTINAIGLFGSILSRRADIIIVDDLCNQENSATEEQRQKVKDWLYTTLLPVLVPGGRFIYLGNTWHIDDLMSNLLKDTQFDMRKRMPAIAHESRHQALWEEWANIHLNENLTPEEKKAQSESFYFRHKEEMDDGVEVLWPERYPYSELYMMRLSNPYSFARMYQCDPSIRPNQKFLETDIEKALTKGRDLVLQDAPRASIETEYTASGLDLAISLKDDSDDTVLLCIDMVKYDCGDIKRGDYIVRNIDRGKFHPNEITDKVRSHDATVRPIGIRVESNGFQEMMVRDLEDHNILITAYKTGGEKNDPNIGVHSLSVLLSRGKLILPFSNRDARTRRLITQLVNEMRAYPDGHTGDSLMALWFAFSEIRDYTANKIIIPSGTYNPPPQGPQTEHEADLDLINRQEINRGGFDHAQALLEMVREADRVARERIADEGRDQFNKMMGRY